MHCAEPDRVAADKSVGIVVIGRNEGDRLMRCLKSVLHAGPCVYVDSGSTDESVALARSLGVVVVELHNPPNFTAARARNSGLEYLTTCHGDLEFVQMVDGDCEVQQTWLAAGIATLRAESDLALVFGRRRERYPHRSIYNALCDDEWNVPVGEAQVAGGDILCRIAALRAIGGYREDMVAGEDPDMALRLRATGWRLVRIDADMTLHDAAIVSFRQWWKRAERAGHAFAELADLHREIRDPDWQRKCNSIIIWAAGFPAATIAACALAPWTNGVSLLLAATLMFAWPYKMATIARQKRRNGLGQSTARFSGILLMIGKFPELQGLIRYRMNRVRGRKSDLIEYKHSQAAATIR